MLNFKSYIRKQRDKPDEVVILMPDHAQWLIDSNLTDLITRQAANQIVSEYGREIIQSIIGEDKLKKAVEDRVVSRIMGDPRDYRR